MTNCEVCGHPTTIDPCEDCSRLIDACDEALCAARRVGVPRYGPSSWADISSYEHIKHATDHITKLLEGDTTEDHLDHAICRLAMVRALIRA